jgi:hypothetical protein
LWIDETIAFSCTGQVMGLLKDDGFSDQIPCPVGPDGFFIFPDDDGAFISLLRSGVVINMVVLLFPIERGTEVLRV